MKRRVRRYLGLAAFAAAAALVIWLSGRNPRQPYAAQMEKAAQLHSEAARLICEEKERRGVALAEEDILGIGLLGYDYSAIMTTTAGLEEKRTSQLPDFAALCVKYFTEAGLKKGDAVGANFSGSYPGFNLAVLCAAEAMGLDLRYSTSVGSSRYGANNPEYTFPEMVKTVVDAGVLSTMPGMVTLGGGGDMGRNMMAYFFEDEDEIAEVEAMKERLIEEGLVYETIENYAQDVQLHEALYGDIRLFANAGGNSLGLGASNNQLILSLGNGLLKKKPDREPTAKSSLTERYLAKDIPVVFLLDARALCEESGIPFDPAEMPKIGTVSMYYLGEPRYSVPAIAAAAAVTIIAAVLIERDERKRRTQP